MLATMLESCAMECNESAPIASSSRAHYSDVRVEVGPPLQTSSGTHFPLPEPARDSAHLHNENEPLIPPSSHSRHSWSPALPATDFNRNPQTRPTLFPLLPTVPATNIRKNVFPNPISASFSNDNSDTSFSQHGHSYPTFPLSSTHSQNASINNISSTRLPTSSHPVFHTTSALAAHHGIPQSLPPLPRTNRQTSDSATASSSTSNTDFDFSSLCANYLTMLSQTPEERPSVAAAESVAVTSTSAPFVPDDSAAVQALMEVIQASPEFRMANDFNEFLTSPMDDSPWEDFLTTPAIGSGEMASELLTSPAIVDSDDFGHYDGMPLFGHSIALSGLDAIKPAVSTRTPAVPSLNLDELYTMPSPNTPSLDPSSLHPTPQEPSLDTPQQSTPSSRRKSAPTGTRKNISPESLVPFDAPIQSRKYVTPSATSRKELPAVFARKRARSQAFGKDEEDELVEELSGATPTPSELDAIEAKRRQNTLAARRSRKRKLEYQRELEISVDKEREEKEMWKAKALMYQALLQSHGHEVPNFN